MSTKALQQQTLIRALTSLQGQPLLEAVGLCIDTRTDRLALNRWQNEVNNLLDQAEQNAEVQQAKRHVKHIVTCLTHHP